MSPCLYLRPLHLRSPPAPWLHWTRRQRGRLTSTRRMTHMQCNSFYSNFLATFRASPAQLARSYGGASPGSPSGRPAAKAPPYRPPCAECPSSFLHSLRTSRLLWLLPQLVALTGATSAGMLRRHALARVRTGALHALTQSAGRGASDERSHSPCVWACESPLGRWGSDPAALGLLRRGRRHVLRGRTHHALTSWPLLYSCTHDPTAGGTGYRRAPPGTGCRRVLDGTAAQYLHRAHWTPGMWVPPGTTAGLARCLLWHVGAIWQPQPRLSRHVGATRQPQPRRSWHVGAFRQPQPHTHTHTFARFAAVL